MNKNEYDIDQALIDIGRDSVIGPKSLTQDTIKYIEQDLNHNNNMISDTEIYYIVGRQTHLFVAGLVVLLAITCLMSFASIIVLGDLSPIWLGFAILLNSVFSVIALGVILLNQELVIGLFKEEIIYEK